MLDLARTTASDRVYDLGAGDGAIVIEAAKKFGATAVGIEYNPDLVKLAQCYIEAEGVADKARMIEGDIFKTDFSSATVLTLFMTESVDRELRPRILRKLREGRNSLATTRTETQARHWSQAGR